MIFLHTTSLGNLISECYEFAPSLVYCDRTILRNVKKSHISTNKNNKETFF